MKNLTDNLYAEIARAYFKEKKVYRYKMKKVCDMDDNEVRQKCHWWYEENDMTSDYFVFEENYLKRLANNETK